MITKFKLYEHISDVKIDKFLKLISEYFLNYDSYDIDIGNFHEEEYLSIDDDKYNSFFEIMEFYNFDDFIQSFFKNYEICNLGIESYNHGDNEERINIMNAYKNLYGILTGFINKYYNKEYEQYKKDKVTNNFNI